MKVSHAASVPLNSKVALVVIALLRKELEGESGPKKSIEL